MRKIISYLKPYLLRISLGMFIKFLGTIVELILPWILSYMIDTVAPQVKESGNVLPIFFWGLAMIFCSFVAVFGNVTANRMAARTSSWAARDIRHDLFKKISYLSNRKIDEFTIPSLVSRLSSDTYNVHNFIGMIQRMGIRAPILLIGGLIVTLMLEPVLTLVLVAIMPLIVLSVVFRIKKGFPLFKKVQEAQDEMVSKVRENITGIRVIKALSKTEYEKQRFNDVNRNVVQKELKANIVMTIMGPLMNLLLNSGIAFVIIVGAYRVASGATKAGVILAFMSYFTIILNAMMSVTRIFTMYTRAGASGNRIAEVLDSSDELEIIDTPAIQTDMHIVFDKVCFSYNGVRNNLTDISFELKRGEALGIIGSTGSGKTTIISLLMRFYDVGSGNIYINGRNVKSIPIEELHRMFGIVFQNDTLFADTIRENIDFGRELTDSDIDHGAKCAQAKEFIDSLEDGYKHMLTIRGSNLSGGQKQRLLIARALAGNPEVIIMDDSSSALDYKTDSLLRKAIKEEYSQTTSIIVAQRISSIMNADHIMVIENGEIIGYGKHDELIRSCASYREISETQMGDEHSA